MIHDEDDEPDHLQSRQDSDSVDGPPEADRAAAQSADFDQCPHCRKFIWQGSVQCPRCGHYIVEESWLKPRRWVVITAIVVLLSLFGLGLVWFLVFHLPNLLRTF